MNIWLTKLGEQTPYDGENVKLSRTAILASQLSSRRHKVTWWASTFDHISKTQRAPRDFQHDLKNGVNLRFIWSPGYENNVSLQRARDHRAFAKRLAIACRKEKALPDIIVCAYPTIEVCDVMLDFAETNKIPIILDVRDMWPDIFLDYAPRILRPIAGWGLKPLRKRAGRTFSRSQGLVSITPSLLSWAATLAGRSVASRDHVAALGYQDRKVTPSELEVQLNFWRELGLEETDRIICFFGVMSKKIDLSAVASAMKDFMASDPTVRLVLCGHGDELKRVKSLFKGINNTIFPGWVDHPKIQALMHMSKLGLAPYVASREDFRRSIPTKVIECLCGALPVITSLSGESRALLESEGCGAFFDSKETFTRSVVRYFDNAALLEDSSSKARQVFEERFTSSKIYSTYCEYIEAQCRPEAYGIEYRKSGNAADASKTST